ncbi:MAG: hypothetical protein ABUS57_11785 [Pseudomonadota bacterium]
MTPKEFLQPVRDHYVDQFRAFVARQRELFAGDGAAEVKLMVNPEAGKAAPYGNIGVVDFAVKKDGGVHAVLFEPDKALEIPRIEMELPGVRADIVKLRGDAVFMNFSPSKVRPDALRNWFEQWFDPEERRFDRAAEFTEAVHYVALRESDLFVDLGTAPPDAFLDLLAALSRAGVSMVRVTDASVSPQVQ